MSYDIKRYVEVSLSIKELTKEKELMEEQMTEQWYEGSKLEIEGKKFVVKKVVSNLVRLKEGVDKTKLWLMFPNAIKTDIDMKVLKKEPAASEFLVLKPSISFRATEDTKEEQDDDDF